MHEQRREPTQIFESIDCLFIGYGNILGSADIVEIGVLRADAGIVEACGDRINGCDLAELILAEIRLHAVEDSELARIDRSSRLKGIDPPAGSLAADEVYLFVFNIVIERSDGIRTAAAACENIIRKASFLLHDLCL